jgi:hypothetical protein
MDLYPPDPDARRVFPPARILQGADIDKSSSSHLAAALRAAGHWVVVPSCVPPGRDYICPDETAVRRALESCCCVAPDCAGALASEGVLLVGHPAGGVAAFDSIPDWPRSSFGRRGIAVYGSNAPRSVTESPVGPPVMMMCGTDDSIVTPPVARRAFQSISWRPKAFLEMSALDLFAIVGVWPDTPSRAVHKAGRESGENRGAPPLGSLPRCRARSPAPAVPHTTPHRGQRHHRTTWGSAPTRDPARRPRPGERSTLSARPACQPRTARWPGRPPSASGRPDRRAA